LTVPFNRKNKTADQLESNAVVLIWIIYNERLLLSIFYKIVNFDCKLIFAKI
jgi:hypothetical protein